MRYSWLLLLSVFTATSIGCQTSEFIRLPHRESSVAFDFSPYTEKGFLFTPQKYTGEYRSVGQITITVWPKVDEAANREIAKSKAAEHDSTYARGAFVIERITTDHLIETAYRHAKSMGADAIVNFQVSPRSRRVGSGFSRTSAEVPGYEISGFAIDRANN